MRRRFAADFLLGAIVRRGGTRSLPCLDYFGSGSTKPYRRAAITQLLIYAINLTSCYFLRTPPQLADGLHLHPQRLDEMAGIRRERRAALDGDVGVETGRLLNFQQPDAGNAAMRHRELVDHGDPEARLHQRADGVAEAGADGD